MGLKAVNLLSKAGRTFATSADDLARYAKACGKRSILETKPTKLINDKVMCYTHTTPHWEFWNIKPPTEAYATKPAIYIDKLYASGKGSGTRKIKSIVKNSLDPETQGRVVLDAMLLDPQKGHPVGFYYKMGFRACDDGINKACEEWIKKGGKKHLAPGHFFDDNTYIPLGGKTRTCIMYLPEENIQHCLNYPDIKLSIMC